MRNCIISVDNHAERSNSPPHFSEHQNFTTLPHTSKTSQLVAVEKQDPLPEDAALNFEDTRKHEANYVIAINIIII
jgi:hypothetical protein